MAKVINLRTRRKQTARAAKRAQGDQSAAHAGVRKADRQASRIATDKAARHLDGHHLATGTTPPDTPD